MPSPQSVQCNFCSHFQYDNCDKRNCVIHAQFFRRPTVFQRISSIYRYTWIKANVEKHLRKETLEKWIYYRLEECKKLSANPLGGAIERLEELEKQIRSLGSRNLKRKWLEEARQQLLKEHIESLGPNVKRKMLDEARQKLLEEQAEQHRQRQRIRRRNTQNQVPVRGHGDGHVGDLYLGSDGGGLETIHQTEHEHPSVPYRHLLVTFLLTVMAVASRLLTRQSILRFLLVAMTMALLVTFLLTMMAVASRLLTRQNILRFLLVAVTMALLVTFLLIVMAVASRLLTRQSILRFLLVAVTMALLVTFLLTVMAVASRLLTRQIILRFLLMAMTVTTLRLLTRQSILSQRKDPRGR